VMRRTKPKRSAGERLLLDEIQVIHDLLTEHGVARRGRMSERVRELCVLDRETALALATARDEKADAELRIQELELAIDHIAAVAIEAGTWRRKPWRSLRAIARLALGTKPLEVVAHG
jgi:hypothetical protein